VIFCCARPLPTFSSNRHKIIVERRLLPRLLQLHDFLQGSRTGTCCIPMKWRTRVHVQIFAISRSCSPMRTNNELRYNYRFVATRLDHSCESGKREKMRKGGGIASGCCATERHPMNSKKEKKRKDSTFYEERKR